MVHAYAVDHLGFQSSHFDIRKDNDRVSKFHERFGSAIATTTELGDFYSLSHQAIEGSGIRYSKFPPNGVQIKK